MPKLTASTGDLDQDLENQQLLAESSLPLLFETADDAKKDNIEHPVIVLVDCEDKIGHEIALGWVGQASLADAIATEQGNRANDTGTTVLARAISWSDACEGIGEVFPYLAEVFEQPAPDNGFLVVSITSGGASALTVPNDARPEIS